MGRPVEAPPEAVRLGSYEIVRKLARGGMAELFLARTVGPEGFAKLVVLKKILPHYAENPKFVRLFLDEAKLVAQMEHPHIAHVYDMGKSGGDYFFTMEYVHGQDIRAVWRRMARVQKPFPVAHAVQIARNIAAALHYAHERTRDDGTLLDIVHRDVSPSNVLISYDGAVKLVDFGVAKAATSTVKTRTGALKGKISYMSPEQAKGAAIDRRSDIFSLGIMLWELVTGRRLYKAENDLATIQMIINAKPQPPSQLRSDCPPKLDAIILRALDGNVAGRYQTAEQMQVDLEALARDAQYDQSTNTLRAFMHELFDEELKIWMDATAAGQTLIDHVRSAQPTMLLPITESDVDDSEIDDDDVHDSQVSLQVDSQVSLQVDSQVGLQVDSQVGLQTDSQAEVLTTIVSALPPTGPLRALVDESPTLSNEDHPSSPTQPHQVQFATIQLSVPPPPSRPHSEPMRAVSEPSPQFGVRVPAQPAAFPYAPAEWRRGTQSSPAIDNSREAITKHVLVACSVLLAIIVLFAIAFGGGGDRRAAARAIPDSTTAPTHPMPASGPKVEMRVLPAQP